jgi:hypothetical protein
MEVQVRIELSGKQEDSLIRLSGSTTIRDEKITRYFRRKNREQRQPAAPSTTGTALGFGNDAWFEASLSLTDASFKLLELAPPISTAKTTVSVYHGQEHYQALALESVEKKLNPFKRILMDVVNPTMPESSFRKVSAEVLLEGIPSGVWADQTFTAVLDLALLLSDWQNTTILPIEPRSLPE